MKTKPIMIALGLVAAIHPLARAEQSPEAPVKLTFDLLKKTIVKEGPGEGAVADENRKIIFPEDLKKLEGKHVVITGFVAPYEDPDKMTKMMVFPNAVGCFYCNPPDEKETVFIRMASKEKPLKMETDSVRAEGVLHLNTPEAKDQEIKMFFFTIDNAKVTPVTGKK